MMIVPCSIFSMSRVTVSARSMALCFVLSVLAHSMVHAEMKTWTDVDGRQIKAEILDADAAKGVLFRLDDKSEVWVPAERLSVGDRLFVRKWTTTRALEEGEKMAEDAKNTPEIVEPPKPPKPSLTPNFDKEWPSVVSISAGLDVETMRETDLSYIYESDHYRFVSTARLQSAMLKKLAVLFETHYEFCKQVPLNFITPRLKEKDSPKLEVFLYEKNAQYLASGGMAGLGACYNSDRKAVMATLKHVGVRVVGSGYTLDNSDAHRELSNEVIHQLADLEWKKLPWLWEGLASYIRSVPYRPGKMVTSNMKSPIMDMVEDPPKRRERDEFDDSELTAEERLQKVAEEIEDETIERVLRFEPGYGLTNQFTSPALEDLMNYNAFRFDADLAAENRQGRVHYGVATLLVYYFLHEDGERKGLNFKKMLFALQEGKTEEEAIKVLLAGRTFSKLQEEFEAYWRQSGLDIVFEEKSPR